jgi:integrase
MAEALTAKRVASVTSERQIDIRDSVVPGLLLRVYPSGIKSWVVWARDRATRRPVTVTLGRWPRLPLGDARDRARDVLLGLELGRRRRRWRVDPGRSVLSLSAAWLRSNRRRLRPSTRREWVRLLRREVVKAWGDRAPRTLERGELQEWLDRIALRAPFIANRSFEVLRRICRWAVAEDLLVRSPCDGLHAPHRERPRERVLDLKEVQAVWAAADAEPRLGRAARLLLLTAARLREVLGMRWADLQLAGDEPTWTVAGDQRKGGEGLVLPLVPAAVELLKAIRARQRPPSEWVFPARGAEGPTRWGHALAARLRETSGVKFRLHDLRRSVASHLAAHGTSADTIEAILGHRRPALVRVYQRYAPLKAMREALSWWEEWLLRR